MSFEPAISRVMLVFLESFDLFLEKMGITYKFPQTAPLILKYQNVEDDVAAHGGAFAPA
jgi:hypothetical protein